MLTLLEREREREREKLRKMEEMGRFTSSVKDFVSKQMIRVRERIGSSSSSLSPSFQRQIEEFYRIHNPSKLPYVEKLARDFERRRNVLMRALHKKYAPCDDVEFVHKSVNYRAMMETALKKIAGYARDDSFTSVDVETCLRLWNGNEIRLVDGLMKKISEFEATAMTAALTENAKKAEEEKDVAALVEQGAELLDEKTRNSIFKSCKRWIAYGVEDSNDEKRKVRVALRGSRRFVEKMEAAKMRMTFCGDEIARKTKILNRSSQNFDAFVKDRVTKWKDLVKEMESFGNIRDDLRSARESISAIREKLIRLQDRASQLEEKRLNQDLKVQVQHLKQNQSLTLQKHRERCEEELKLLQVACDGAVSLEADRRYREMIETFRSKHDNLAEKNKKSDFVSNVKVTSRDGSRHSVDIRFSLDEDPVLVATSFASKYDIARKDYEALLKFLREKMVLVREGGGGGVGDRVD